MRSVIITLLLAVSCWAQQGKMVLDPVLPGSLVRISADVQPDTRYIWLPIWPRGLDTIRQPGMLIFASGCVPGAEYEVARLAVPNDVTAPITEQRFVVRVEGDGPGPGPGPGPPPPPGPDPPDACDSVQDGPFNNLAKRACQVAPEELRADVGGIYRDAIQALQRADRRPDDWHRSILDGADFMDYVTFRRAAVALPLEWGKWFDWLAGEYGQYRSSGEIASLWDQAAFYAEAARGLGVTAPLRSCRVENGRVICD